MCSTNQDPATLLFRSGYSGPSRLVFLLKGLFQFYKCFLWVFWDIRDVYYKVVILLIFANGSEVIFDMLVFPI